MVHSSMLHFHNIFGCSGSDDDDDDVCCCVSSIGYRNNRSMYACCDVPFCLMVSETSASSCLVTVIERQISCHGCLSVCFSN